MTTLSVWDTTEEEIAHAMDVNPSLRGMVLGYVAEIKLKSTILRNPNVSSVHKQNDHNRKIKCDLIIVYKNRQFLIEVKSVQTNSVKTKGSFKTGLAQVDASDKRKVKFEDGSIANTTLLLRNRFDILAVNCFPFTGKWDFVFCLNNNLPKPISKNYSSHQQNSLIASPVCVSYPCSFPYTDDVFRLMDSTIDSIPFDYDQSQLTLEDFMT
jgi:hypothetical protein